MHRRRPVHGFVRRVEDLARMRRPSSQATAEPPGASTCHVPPIFTEPRYNLHTALAIGIDSFKLKLTAEQQRDLIEYLKSM